MLEIQIKNTIANEDVQFYFGDDYKVFSLQSLKDILLSEENKNETSILLNIHCQGGSVEEGLAIYDYLRTSGKTIYTNIEGACHSMAVVLLLSAPIENRTANPNCSALIHKVSTTLYGEYTEDTLTAITDSVQKAEEKILKIYADRTSHTIEQMQEYMNEQKERTANDLLLMGFISKINEYNTNKKNINTKKYITMNEQKTTLLNKANALLKDISNFFSGVKFNYVFPDATGGVLFSTERDDDHIEIGLQATPDGIFELTKDTSEYKEGTTITVQDGKITDIVEVEEQEQQTEEENNNLSEEVAHLTEENNHLRTMLENANNLIQELKGELQSTFTPKTRKINTKKQPISTVSKNDYIEEFKKLKK